MSEILGSNGIEVHPSSQVGDPVLIELDSETRLLLEFVKELRVASATYNGYNFGKTFLELLDDVAVLHTQINEDKWYKDNNPAVKDAWENYQLMLGLARESDADDVVRKT